MCGDVLQFGFVQDSSPDLFPQPLPLRATCGVDRTHRCRPAFVPVVLSASARAAPFADRHRARLPPRAPLCRLPARLAKYSRRLPLALSTSVCARGEPSAPGALIAVL